LLQGTAIEGALSIAEDLRALVEDSRILPEGNMTISIGVCEVRPGNTVDQWFKLADSGLYMAKRNGRNRVETAAQVSAERMPVSRTVPDWR
jgi:diguanylate cyclase (GGDEF)-like protein